MKTIDVTPSWESILPTLLVLLKDGNAEGQAAAERELKRMAQLADSYVKVLKAGEENA